LPKKLPYKNPKQKKQKKSGKKQRKDGKDKEPQEGNAVQEVREEIRNLEENSEGCGRSRLPSPMRALF
jgi:hypothetical protein